MPSMPINTRLVVVAKNAYEPFKDGQSGEMRPGGVSIDVWVLDPVTGKPPFPVRVPPKLHQAVADLDGAPMGTPVHIEVEPTTRQNSIDVSWRYVDHQLAKPAGAAK